MNINDLVKICGNILDITKIISVVDPNFRKYQSVIKTYIDINPKRVVDSLYIECKYIRDNTSNIDINTFAKLVMNRLSLKFNTYGAAFDIGIYTSLDIENKHLIQCKVKQMLSNMKISF